MITMESRCARVFRVADYVCTRSYTFVCTANRQPLVQITTTNASPLARASLLVWTRPTGTEGDDDEGKGLVRRFVRREVEKV